jgi:hypothetical protein
MRLCPLRDRTCAPVKGAPWKSQTRPRLRSIPTATCGGPPPGPLAIHGFVCPHHSGNLRCTSGFDWDKVFPLNICVFEFGRLLPCLLFNLPTQMAAPRTLPGPSVHGMRAQSMPAPPHLCSLPLPPRLPRGLGFGFERGMGGGGEARFFTSLQMHREVLQPTALRLSRGPPSPLPLPPGHCTTCCTQVLCLPAPRVVTRVGML